MLLGQQYLEKHLDQDLLHQITDYIKFKSTFFIVLYSFFKRNINLKSYLNKCFAHTMQ